MRRRRPGLGVFLVAVAAASPGVARGVDSPAARRNLVSLTKDAQDIVVGDVVRINEGLEGYVPYVEIELKVSETLKGARRRSLTFRQLGLLPKESADDGRRASDRTLDMPRFALGESVILFLEPPSSTGFRTTVGLQQGKFTVREGLALNTLENVGLFNGVTAGDQKLDSHQQAMLATRRGGVQAATLIDFVRRAVRQHWW